MANKRFIDFPIATTVGDNDIILIWQSGANKQTTKATILSGVPDSLNDLTDVTISGLTNGQILRYDSVSGQWENTDQGNLDLNDLNDVTIVSPTNGQVLVYNSSTSKWENSSGGYVPYVGAVTTVNLGAQTIQAGSFVKQGGTASQFLKANGSVDSTAYGTGSVTSVGLTMPAAFNVANSPITTAGTLAVTGAGTVAQYIRGDGSLADFPETSGGGASVSYYLNGSVSQGTIGGIAYREMNKVPIFGAGTDFTINANGYIASFITDAGDPNLLEIPGGNWNFETYFSASSNGGSPTFYVELYKVNAGGTATLIASNSAIPELIAFGTNITAYFTTLAVPTTTLALTDRLAVRYYVTHSGRTITMHTEGPHLCQIITTFTTGLTALNGLTAQVQNFAVGTTGTDFNIASATATHTFNLPTASATNRGALSSADWSMFNAKENAITAGTTAQYFRGDKTFQTLNTAAVPELTNLYYTEARVNANTNVAANTAARHNAVTLGTANGLSLSTQVLSLGLASAGVTGALSGTDWSTFNAKQNALTNPVTGTGNNNYIAKFTSTGSTVGNSLLQSTTSNVFINQENSSFGIDSQINTRLGFTKVSGAQPYLTYASDSFVIASSSGANIESSNTFTPRLSITTSGRVDIPGVLRLTGLSQVDFQAFTGSAYTNLFYDAASHNWQTSGGTAKMTLVAGGNLLVGTISDNGARLQVEHNGNSPLLISTSSTTLFTTYRSNSVVVGYIGNGDGIVTGGGATNFGIRAENDLIFTSGGNNRRLTIAATGAATFSNSLTVTGTITSLITADGILSATTASTSRKFITIANTGSTLNIGIENSAGGDLATGTSAYATVIASTIANRDLQFATTNTVRLTIASTGAATFTSTIRSNATNGFGIGSIASYRRIQYVSANTTFSLLNDSNALANLEAGAATFSASLALPHTTKSANYTLNGTDYTVGFDCASNRTANLPDATTCAGRIYVIYQYNTGNLGQRYVTLDGNGSQTINGLTTVSLQYYYDYSSLMIQSNGSNWIIIADAAYPAPV